MLQYCLQNFKKSKNTGKRLVKILSRSVNKFLSNDQSFDMPTASQVRRSVQFFLDNLLDQRPDQQQTLSAIGEVS